ncbi:MAG: aminopeptidase [Clostridia bacterium]|nr:aminopeptidase [Clostridia bacterium]
MNQNDKRTDEYAALLVQVGINIQKGQTLVIACPVDCAWFARKCAAAAYEVGCRSVVMRWRDDALTRMKFLHAADDVFDTVPQWEADCMNGHAANGDGYLSIAASDPMNLLGVDSDRIKRSARASGKAFTVFNEQQMSNGFPWCIGSVPIPSWAKKVFPNLSDEEAVDALWEAIFAAVRVTGDGKAVERWKAHLANLDARTKQLNAYNFKSLHYQNALGTDFTVSLPEKHIWQSGADVSRAGVPFIANIPTEEIFTAPLRDSANGTICASLPLVKDGNVIRGIRFEVENGKIVRASADEGEETLQAAISVDEGASYFGEVALVPYDSPISNQKILFYQTLFDENASCHLAFGEAYPCIEGGEKMSKEERKAHGLNDSITHVDFMIGTPDLSITGITQDGREVPVFRDGNFVF